MSKFKIGDKVRFVSEGIMGEHNKLFNVDFERDYLIDSIYSNGNTFVLALDGNRTCIVSRLQIKLIPEPQPKFANIKVGDWVEHFNGTHLLITAMEEPVNIKSPHIKDRTMKFKCNNRNTYSVFDGSCIHDEDRIVKVLSPKEVIVDFGSGIRGTVTKVSDYICVYDKCGELVAWVKLSLLDLQTRAKVESLCKAQGEQ